jgi:hypothetical protein
MAWSETDEIRETSSIMKVNSIRSTFDKDLEISSSEMLSDADMETKGSGFEITSTIFAAKQYVRSSMDIGVKEVQRRRSVEERSKVKTPIDKRKRSFCKLLIVLEFWNQSLFTV